jgi:hypothetical protein
MLGAKSDKEIVDYIMFNIEDQGLRDYVEQYIYAAFRAPYNRSIFAGIKNTRDTQAYFKAICRRVYQDCNEDNMDHYITQFK